MATTWKRYTEGCVMEKNACGGSKIMVYGELNLNENSVNVRTLTWYAQSRPQTNKEIQVVFLSSKADKCGRTGSTLS